LPIKLCPGSIGLRLYQGRIPGVDSIIALLRGVELVSEENTTWRIQFRARLLECSTKAKKNLKQNLALSRDAGEPMPMAGVKNLRQKSSRGLELG
jgi:hypothetical protein